MLERLDRVLFVPTGNQHYRSKPQAGAEHRCAMILGAIESNPAFASGSHRFARGRQRLHRRSASAICTRSIPARRFTFIIGADSLANANWVRFDEVLEALERFVDRAAPRRAGRRIGTRHRGGAARRLRERVTTLNLPEIPIGRGLIRTLLAQGRSVRYLVPEPVWQYIVAQRTLRLSRDGAAA